MPNIVINNIEFSHSNSQFTAYGFPFHDELFYDQEFPIEYWRAQLAFRGWSPRGNNIEALKRRLRDADMPLMDPVVEEKLQEWSRQVPRQLRAANSPNGIRRSAPYAPIQPPAPYIPHNIPVQPRRPERILNRILTGRDAVGSLRGYFFDETGRDTNAEPLELRDLQSYRRAQFHQEADELNLYHRTAVTARGDEILVIGSGRNHLGQQRFAELDSVPALVPYQPRLADYRQIGGPHGVFHRPDSGDGEEEGDEDEEEADDENDEDDEQNEVWDINGTWEIGCDRMAAQYGQYEMWTLEIFTDRTARGKEMYGEFLFGTFEGVFRFCNSSTNAYGRWDYVPQKNKEFIVENETGPSEEEPILCYRWRGKERGEDIIQLGEDSHVYTMTFSEGGTAVDGIWGTKNGDPGEVQFTGRKIGNRSAFDTGPNISYEWRNLSQRAYDKANRDRWRCR